MSVEDVLVEIENGDHATKSRDFGRGMSHAAKLIREALESEQAEDVRSSSFGGRVGS